MKILRINSSDETSHIFEIHYFDMINFQSFRTQNYEGIIGFLDEKNNDKPYSFLDGNWKPEIYEFSFVEINFNLNGIIESISGTCPKLIIQHFEKFIREEDEKFFTLNLVDYEDLIVEKWNAKKMEMSMENKGD